MFRSVCDTVSTTPTVSVSAQAAAGREASRRLPSLRRTQRHWGGPCHAGRGRATGAHRSAFRLFRTCGVPSAYCFWIATLYSCMSWVLALNKYRANPDMLPTSDIAAVIDG